MSATPEGVESAITKLCNAVVAFRTSTAPDVGEEARAFVKANKELDAAIAAHVAARVGEERASFVANLDAALVALSEAMPANPTPLQSAYEAGALRIIEGVRHLMTTPEARDGE